MAFVEFTYRNNEFIVNDVVISTEVSLQIVDDTENGTLAAPALYWARGFNGETLPVWLQDAMAVWVKTHVEELAAHYHNALCAA